MRICAETLEEGAKIIAKKGKEIGENMVILLPETQKKTQKKRGRRMKIETAKDLERLTEKYFSTISYTVPVTDPSGAIMTDIDGEMIERTIYITPPDVISLCLFLGITYTTWENYCDQNKHPEFNKICERVKMRMEAYLREVLVTREKGSLQGVIFNLEHNYGWREKKEIELGDKTRDAVAEMSLAEKMAMVAALKSGELDIPEPIEDNEDDDE